MFASRICAAVCLVISLTGIVPAQDLKTDDVIAKHLASIGTAEKRKELKNTVLLGFSQFASKLPERKSAGKVAIVSDTSNLLFISSFLSESYPFEKIGLFDGKVNIPFVLAGLRSPLGTFLVDNTGVIKNGLFAGAMSLNWVFLDADLKKGKAKLIGTKKIDDRKVYVMEYFMKGGSSALNIRLFFDTETFQHVRTQYLEVVSGKSVPIGTFNQTGGLETQLIEDFSDFTTVEGVTLPGKYKIHYLVNGPQDTYEYDWIFKVNEVKFNQPLKEGFFTFN